MGRVVIGAVVAAVAALAWTGSAGAQTIPGEDSVTGFGAHALPTCEGPLCFRPRFDFDAHSGPSGEPGGTVRYRLEYRDGSALIDYVAPVTCLDVDANEATIGLDLSAFEPPNFPSPGTAIVIWVVDGGVTGPDFFTYDTLFEPASCDRPRERELLPVAEGDILVTEAPRPVPTTKDQCRDGGWRDFAIFQNQGQCIAYVAQDPKD